jgi:hypothetical protein
LLNAWKSLFRCLGSWSRKPLQRSFANYLRIMQELFTWQRSQRWDHGRDILIKNIITSVSGSSLVWSIYFQLIHLSNLQTCWPSLLTYLLLSNFVMPSWDGNLTYPPVYSSLKECDIICLSCLWYQPRSLTDGWTDYSCHDLWFILRLIPDLHAINLYDWTLSTTMETRRLNLATNQSIRLDLIVSHPIYTIESIWSIPTSEWYVCVLSVPPST